MPGRCTYVDVARGLQGLQCILADGHSSEHVFRDALDCRAAHVLDRGPLKGTRLECKLAANHPPPIHVDPLHGEWFEPERKPGELIGNEHAASLRPPSESAKCGLLAPPNGMPREYLGTGRCERELGHPWMHVAGNFAWSLPTAPASLHESALAHWHTLGKTVQRQVLERYMLALRSAGLGLPHAIRLEYARQWMREIVGEGQQPDLSSNVRTCSRCMKLTRSAFAECDQCGHEESTPRG